MNMVRIIKIGDVVYENFPAKSLTATRFDENGNPVEFQEVWNVPTNLEELRKVVKDTIVWLGKQKVTRKLESYDYISLGDVKVYADAGSEEAQSLLDWYIGFENRLWGWIENELPQKTFEELIQINLYDLVESFDE